MKVVFVLRNPFFYIIKFNYVLYELFFNNFDIIHNPFTAGNISILMFNIISLYILKHGVQ